jgi:hypothetical protein
VWVDNLLIDRHQGVALEETSKVDVAQVEQTTHLYISRCCSIHLRKISDGSLDRVGVRLELGGFFLARQPQSQRRRYTFRVEV